MSGTVPLLNNWYVVIVKSIPYRKAAIILQKLGYVFYLPLQKQLHYWSDRKRWMDMPILAPYLFLLTNEQERRLLFESCDCFRFLTCDGKLAIAKEEEVQKVKLLCNHSANVRLEACEVKKGNYVTITQGPFAGMSGYALQENGNHRFLVQIKSLGKFASVDIESRFLKTC